MSSLEPFRFLHTGDLHLASPVEGLSSEAPPEVPASPAAGTRGSPPGDAGVGVEIEGGEARMTDELSRGTAEQLFLALRSGRAAAAADAVRHLATHHQVIYFTCHAETADVVDPGGERTVGPAS